MSDVGIYIPDNRPLDDLLAEMARRGQRSDHAALLLHFVCVKEWLGDLDDGFARLSADILRRWIQPRAFTPIKQFLMGAGVIEMAPYSVGQFTAGYRVTAPFFGPPRRWIVQHQLTASKLLAFRQRHNTAGENGDAQAVIQRRLALLDHQRDSLAVLSLSGRPEVLSVDLRDAHDVDPGHVLYVAHAIVNGDHDGLSIDPFGWRLHSIVTRTSSHLRPHLLLDGRPVAEVDVANSQPLLLAILLECTTYEGDAQHIKQMHNIMEGVWAGVPCLDAASPGVAGSELLCYRRDACGNGKIYDLLAGDCNISRVKAKRELFRDVFFGKPCIRGKITMAFGRRWPSILAWIQNSKRKYGHKIIAQALQRLESIIMLDCIGGRLMRELPGVPFLTIHDSALLVADRAEAVRQIMVDEFARWGVKATIRVK